MKPCLRYHGSVGGYRDGSGAGVGTGGIFDALLVVAKVRCSSVPAVATLSTMFEALLKDVVESTDGGVSSLVMDFEGIALDSYSKPGADFDIKTIGIELSVVLRSIRQAAEMLGAGEAREMSLVADGMTTVVRLLNENYFVALSLEPGGNVGKGRYLLRTRAGELNAELI